MLKGGIGFFDSGVGGLSILHACRDVVRGLPIYYYGDNLHAPYGNRPIYETRAYVRDAFAYFAKMQVRAVVVACNTVTALFIDELRRDYPFPIIGIEPAVLPAVEQGDRVLVLATVATAGSERLRALVARAKEKNPNAEITVYGSRELAAVVENGFKRYEIDLSRYLPCGKYDCVVLGCTHYTFLKEKIGEYYAARVFDGNMGVANRLKGVLLASVDDAKNVDFRAAALGKIRLLSNLPFYLREKGAKKVVFWRKTGKKNYRVKNATILYFIGAARVKNRQFYERMFGF